MHYRWVKILLLATFAYWATGTAKHVHEALEHHGRDASIDDDDGDDDDGGAVAVALPLPTPSSPDKQAHEPKQKHPCPICQILAVMAVEKSAPPVAFAPTLDVIAVVVIPDWQSPVVRAEFTCPTTGPPITSEVS